MCFISQIIIQDHDLYNDRHSRFYLHCKLRSDVSTEPTNLLLCPSYCELVLVRICLQFSYFEQRKNFKNLVICFLLGPQGRNSTW